MTNFSKPTKRDYVRSIIYISIYLLVISASAFLFLPNLWYIWLLFVLAGVLLLVNWHKEQTVYQCPHCQHVFEVSFLTDLISPHGLDKNGAWLFLRCPSCKHRSKTKVMKKID